MRECHMRGGRNLYVSPDSISARVGITPDAGVADAQALSTYTLTLGLSADVGGLSRGRGHYAN